MVVNSPQSGKKITQIVVRSTQTEYTYDIAIPKYGQRSNIFTPITHCSPGGRCALRVRKTIVSTIYSTFAPPAPPPRRR